MLGLSQPKTRFGPVMWPGRHPASAVLRGERIERKRRLTRNVWFRVKELGSN